MWRRWEEVPLVSLLLVLMELCGSVVGPTLPEYPFISCFSCASEEYESLFQRAQTPALFGRPLLFDRLCDSRLELGALSASALVPCDSACISVLEPQFFGGVQNERRPFTFVRGCASDIFELAIASAGPEGVPAEIEFLHRAQACLELPISQIWPQLGTGSGSAKELVRVCSCANDECNRHDEHTSALSGAGRSGFWRHTSILTIFIIFLFNF